jgi:hypothetical protein
VNLARTVPRSRRKVKCSAATLGYNPELSPRLVLFNAPVALYSRPRASRRRDRMETTMQKIGTATLAIVGSLLGFGAAQADYVPPFKGNDTGGIISYNLVGQADIKALAVEHCARYGKVVKLLGVQAEYGGYISFACRWVPYGADQRPLRTKY